NLRSDEPRQPPMGSRPRPLPCAGVFFLLTQAVRSPHRAVTRGCCLDRSLAGGSPIMKRSAFGFCAALTVGVGAIVLATSVAAQTTDPVKCHKEVVKRLANYKKTYLKAVEKCLDRENEGKAPGPCPDALATFKINKTVLKAEATIPLKCSLTDLTTTLGYRSDCAYEAATTGVEGTCAAKPVTTPAEFADCLVCWKGAALAVFVVLLYASHANEVCQSDLRASAPVRS